MPAASTITTYVFWLVAALMYITPSGTGDLASERPKRGFWKARDILWPIRRFGSISLVNSQLSKAYNGALFWAFVVSGLTALAVRFIPNVAKAVSPVWLMVEAAVIGIFFGNAWGFWSADQKLQKAKAVGENTSC